MAAAAEDAERERQRSEDLAFRLQEVEEELE